jgi:hypothetical protein
MGKMVEGLLRKKGEIKLSLSITMNRFSRQCVILNISQTYRPPRPVTLFLILFIVCNVAFIICVALRAVFCLRTVCYFVWYVYLCVVSCCSNTATG